MNVLERKPLSIKVLLTTPKQIKKKKQVKKQTKKQIEIGHGPIRAQFCKCIFESVNGTVVKNVMEK